MAAELLALPDNEINFYFFYYYVSKYDSDFEIFSNETINFQKALWDFKEGRNQNFFIEIVSKKIKELFNDLTDVVLICIPCSSEENYDTRYKDFSENICSQLKIINGNRYHKIIKPTQSDINFFKNKKVLLFQELVCTGLKIKNELENLKKLNANIAYCLTLGCLYDRTKNGHNPSHPWSDTGIRDDSEPLNFSDPFFTDTVQDDQSNNFNFFETNCSNNGILNDSEASIFDIDNYNQISCKNVETHSDSNIGREITFGMISDVPLSWIIIAESEKYVLLISKYSVVQRPYNDELEFTTWERCSLRKWLNVDFYNSAFSEEEKERIILKKVVADVIKGHELNPGNNTIDKIHILNIREYQKLFNYENVWKCYVMPGKKLKQCWLRNYGVDRRHAAFIGRSGSIHQGGSLVNSERNAVRPVIWIKK
jgi:hypothetical protein